MSQAPEYAEEYTKTERLRWVALGMAGALAALLIRKYVLLPGISRYIAWAPGRILFGVPAFSLLWYGLFVGLPLALAGLVALTLGRRGRRILRDGQVPPPGEKVFSPTRIRRGKGARRIGHLHLFAVLPFLILALWGARQAARLAARPAQGASHP